MQTRLERNACKKGWSVEEQINRKRKMRVVLRGYIKLQPVRKNEGGTRIKIM
jgi:hypothetical protein